MPELDELRYHPQARAEGLRRAGQLSEGHLKALIESQKRECRQSTRLWRTEAEEQWRYYQSDIDWSDKESWQSTAWIPMPWTAVEQATSVLQRALVDNPSFFGLEGTGQRSKLLANKIWKPALEVLLGKAKYPWKFMDAIKIGFITGMGYHKFRWRSAKVPILQGYVDTPMGPMPNYEVKQRGMLEVETVHPSHIYRDVRSKPREPFSGSWIVHEQMIDRPFLLNGAAAGFYKNVEKVREGYSWGDIDYAGGASPYADARRKGFVYSTPQFAKMYRADEWWGDVLDENGELVCPDCLVLKVNEEIVMGPVDNPVLAFDPTTGRRKWPIIGYAPIQHPARYEGWSILRAVTPIAVIYSNLFNLFADGLNWDVNPETEVDLSNLHDWDDLEHYPGRLWLKNGPTQALIPAQAGRMNIPALLASLQHINTEFQNNSFVTNFVQGLPGYRSNITKGETQIKTAQSLSVFDGMARSIESGGVEAVALAYDLASQFLSDFSDPSIMEIVGPMGAMMLNSLPPERRLAELRGEFNYKFTGISAALQKADQLGRVMQLAQLSAAGLYAGRINPSQMLEAVRDILALGGTIDVAPEPIYLPKGGPPDPKVSVSLKGDLDPITAHELLSTQLAQIEQRMAALEQGQEEPGGAPPPQSGGARQGPGPGPMASMGAPGRVPPVPQPRFRELHAPRDRARSEIAATGRY